MIPSGAKVYVATRPVDFRKGPDGLAALVRDTGADPFSGALYVFRAKRADRVKIVWWDGSGLCLFAKRLDEDRFRWPRVDRKNALFAGSDGGGQTWATIATLPQTAKMNDVDPFAWLATTLQRIAAGWPNRDLDQLLPWHHAD
jgi:hypothetical protein